MQKPPEYIFSYTDTDILPNELNDFFSYDSIEQELLLAAKLEFEEKWGNFHSRAAKRKTTEIRKGGNINGDGGRWRDALLEKRKGFVVRSIDALEDASQSGRVKALECLSYVVQGRSVFCKPSSGFPRLAVGQGNS